MTSRVGISKVLIPSSSFAMGVIPSIAPYTLTSSTVAASDWTSSRLYCEYTASNGSNQVSMATYVSPQVGSPFYLNQPLSLSLVGVNQNMIVDMDLSTAAEVKVWFTEVGDTTSPGTINASLMLTHDRALFINQQLPALTPITTQGDLIVGDINGNAIRLGIGSAAQVLTVAGSTAVWETPSGGGGGIAQPAYDFTSATGLTPFLGTAGNTITVGGGVAAIYSPAAAGMLRYDPIGYGFLSGPALYRNFDIPVAEFDVAARVLAPGGYADGYCRYGIEVATLGAFANITLPRQRFTYQADNGALYWEDETGYRANLAGAVPLDGTGWLRIQMIGTTMTFWLGISSGNIVPTTWTMKKRFIPTAALYESVCVSMQLGGSMPTPTTANFGALAVLIPATL